MQELISLPASKFNLAIVLSNNEMQALIKRILCMLKRVICLEKCISNFIKYLYKNAKVSTNSLHVLLIFCNLANSITIILLPQFPPEYYRENPNFIIILLKYMICFV